MKLRKTLSSIAVASMLLASPATIFASEGTNTSSISITPVQEAISEKPVYSMAVHIQMAKEVEQGLITTDEQAWERMAEIDKMLGSSDIVTPMSAWYGGYLSSVAEMTAATIAVDPVDAYKAFNLGNLATSAARNSGYPGETDGKQDAFRHGYWNILMTRDIGATHAKEISDIHEKYNPGTSMQKTMDDFNNFAGRGLFPGGNPSNSTLVDIIKTGMTNGYFCYINSFGEFKMTNH